MEKIKKISINVRFNPGLFANSNMEKLARIIDVLIKKTDEQTDKINQLIDENTELKKLYGKY